MYDAVKTIKLFAEQYYEKIFYFSLKKTGNRTEAEDLTSDIILDIISALRKGAIPEYFSAYVWKVARSRFCRWAEKKANSRKYLDANDFGELDLRDEKRGVEEDYIVKEDINALRREISLISKDYREILVSFYIDDKKIPQIAKEFNLPEGTVKTKLFKSRKILMEGMKMAREFGVKSYKPENVSFTKSGSDGTDGSPWSKLKTKLAKNILLEAYYNPSTIEELSLELGVAAPYMEEAVEELVNATLMKKLDKNKYETDFMIINAETQRDIENAHLKIKDAYFELAKEIIAIVEKEGEKDLLGGTQTFEELKWLYLLNLADGIDCHTEKKPNLTNPPSANPIRNGYTKRPYDGQWDLLGFEEYQKGEYFSWIEYNGNGYNGSKIRTSHYGFNSYSWGERVRWFNPEQTKAIEKILDGKVDEADKNIVEELVNLGAFEIKDGKYTCKIAICKRYENLISQSVSEDVLNNKIMPVYDKISSLRKKVYDEIEEAVKKSIPERLREKSWFIIGDNMHIRPYVFNTALKAGYLTIPEDFSKSMVGVCVYR